MASSVYEKPVRSNRLRGTTRVLMLLCIGAAQSADGEEANLRAGLQHYCFRCHGDGSGKVKGKARSEQLGLIAAGNADIVIGTHALFQEEVRFSKLGLVIIGMVLPFWAVMGTAAGTPYVAQVELNTILRTP